MTAMGTLLTVFLLVLAIAGGLWVYSTLEQKRSEALETLAARRGWSLNVTKQSLGHPAILRLTPKSGPAWQTEVRHHTGRMGKPGRSATILSAPATTWSDGLMIIGPTIGEDDAEFGDAIMRQFDNQVARSLMGRVLGHDKSDMQTEVSAWITSDRLTLFASKDPSVRTDLGDLTKVFTDWTPLQAGDSGQPVLVLNESGLHIGLGHGIRNAAKLESFIDYAIRLNRHFSKP